MIHNQKEVIGNMKCFHSNCTDYKLGYGQAPTSHLALITKSYFSRQRMSRVSSTGIWLMNNFVVTFSEEFAQKSICENSRHNKFILQVCCFLGGFLVENDHQSHVLVSVRVQLTKKSHRNILSIFLLFY